MSSQPPPPFGPPGGYGPPPVYTPPPGYGPPPPYGMPPMAPLPPKRTGPSTAALVGIGCAVGFGVLLVLGVGVFAYVAMRGAPTPAPAPVASAASAPTPKAELQDVRSWRGELSGFPNFVAEIVNTGTEPIGFPQGRVTLLDASGAVVHVGSCTTPIHALEPKNRVPCAFTIRSKVEYASYKAEVSGLPVTAADKLANLSATEIKFTPKRGYAPATLEGKVTNASTFKARHVMALVSLYDADNKIVAAQTVDVPGGDLDAGGAAVFTAKIYELGGAPQNYRVRVIGYE